MAITGRVFRDDSGMDDDGCFWKEPRVIDGMIPCHYLTTKCKLAGRGGEEKTRTEFRSEKSRFSPKAARVTRWTNQDEGFDQFPPKRNLTFDLNFQPHRLFSQSSSPPPLPSFRFLRFPPFLYLKSIGGSDFAMLARSLLRVPNRAIARQSLGKSTVRLVLQPPIH